MSEINRYGISGGAAVQIATGYFPEGQSPSSLNDASRTVMADVRRYVEQTTPETTATYSAGAYTLALTRDLSAGELTQGFTAAFIAGSTNSASATLNINSTGAKNLLDSLGSHILGEAIQNHQPVNVVYDKKKDGFRVTDQLNTIANVTIPDDGNIGSASDTDAMAIASTGTVTFAKQPSFPDANPRQSNNFVRNGDMAVAQRGTQSIAASGYAYGACDGWKIWMGSAAAVDASQDAESPDGFNNSLKLDITTADTSVAAADAAMIQHLFEGFDMQSLNKGDAQAKALTISFWVRSPVTGVHILECYDYDNTRFVSQSYTISSADTWEYHSCTFPPDTTGALDDDNARSFNINFWLLAGSNYTGGGSLQTTWGTTTNNRAVGQVNVLADASDFFYLTGIQMELGEVATNFQYQTYGANLARCARYYLQRAASSAALYGSSVSGSGFNYSHWQFPVPMRTAPTMTGHTGTQQQISVLSGGVFNSAGSYAIWGNGSTASAEL
jgi:hypothetical protein